MIFNLNSSLFPRMRMTALNNFISSETMASGTITLALNDDKKVCQLTYVRHFNAFR